MIPEGLDQLCPGHRRAALDADLPGPPEQVRLGPVVIGTALAAFAAHPAARDGGRLVRDPGRFFLARALAAELGVHRFVFDLRSGHGLLTTGIVIICVVVVWRWQSGSAWSPGQPGGRAGST